MNVVEMIDAVLEGASPKDAIQETGHKWSAAHHVAKKLGHVFSSVYRKGGKKHRLFHSYDDSGSKEHKHHKSVLADYHKALKAHGFFRHKKTPSRSLVHPSTGIKRGSVSHYKHKDGSRAQLISHHFADGTHRAAVRIHTPGKAAKK